MANSYKYYDNGSSFRNSGHYYENETNSEDSWSRKSPYISDYDSQEPFPQRYNTNLNKQGSEYKVDYSQSNTEYYSRNHRPSSYPENYDEVRRNNSYYPQESEQGNRNNSIYFPRYEVGRRKNSNYYERFEEDDKTRRNFTQYDHKRSYSQSQGNESQYYETDGQQDFRQEDNPLSFSRRNWSTNDSRLIKQHMNYSQFCSNERESTQAYPSGNFRSEVSKFENSSFYPKTNRRNPDSFDRYYARSQEPYPELRNNFVNNPQLYKPDNSLGSNLPYSHHKSNAFSLPSQQYVQKMDILPLDINSKPPVNLGKSKFKGMPGKKGKKLTKKQMKALKQKKKGKKAKKGGINKKKPGKGPSAMLNKQRNENNKRPRDDDDPSFTDEIERNKKMVKYEKVMTSEEQINHVRARSTPLAHMPYPQQIKLKYNDGKKLVLNICEGMAAVNPHVKKWMDEQKKINEGLPCKIHDIVYKEKDYDYYRNRVELLIGLDSITRRRCVGMRCGIGGIAPLEDDLKTIPKILLPYIRAFERFLSNSQMEVSQVNSPNDGVWKHLSFKVGFKTNQILMMVGFQVSKLSDNRILKATDELKDFYESPEGQGITSLFLQLIKERDKNGPSLHSKHVLGQEWIEEIIDDVTFKIKPQSDIPNCQWGAELINQTVRKLGRLNNNTFMIDVGSPLGTVSLCVAKDCQKCYFIEPKFLRIPSKNAKNVFMKIPEENNITNWSQSQARVQNILGTIVKKLQLTKESDVLMYFDPWCALRGKGVATVYSTLEISRLLFLTCGKKLMINNFIELAKKGAANPEETYVPVEAVPIDTYPHTTHMAVFILLERIRVARARQQDTREK